MNSVNTLNSGARKMIRTRYLGLLFSLLTLSFYAQAQTIVTTIGNVSGCPGQDILVPINVTNFNSITSMSIKIKYDTSNLTALSVLNFNTATTGATIVPNIFTLPGVPDTGYVAIAIFATNGTMSIGSGLLCNIKFKVKNKNSFSNLRFNTWVPGDCEYSDQDYAPISSASWVDGSLFTLPSFAVNASNQSILPGGNGYFYVVAMGDNSYQWQLSTNGGSIWNNLSTSAPYGDVTNDTLFINGATVGMNGYKYRCIATSLSGGCPAPYNATTSKAVTLTVAVSCPSVYTVTGGGNYCPGGSGVHVFLSGSEVGVTYQLKLNNVNTGPTVAGTGSVLDFGLLTALGNYTVTGSNANICSPVAMTGTVAVGNYSITNGAISGSVNICGATFTPITFTLNGFKPFDVVYTDGTSQYSFNVNANNHSIIVNPSVTTTYTLLSAVDGHGCNLTITGSPAVITIKPTPVAVATSNSPVCTNQSINLSNTGSSGAISYVWTFNGVTVPGGANPTISPITTANAGLYTLTATGANACTAVATTDVIVNTVPSAAGAITGTATVCKLASASYSVGTIAGATAYNWTLPAGASITSGSNTNSIVVLFSAAAVSGNITVAGQSSCGDGAVSANFPVTVNTIPTPTAGNNGPVCAGVNLNLTSSGGISYSWSGPNGFTSTAQNPALGAATVAMSGLYTVNVLNAAGCSATATTTATVNANPTAVAGSNSPVCSGSFLNLTSSGGNAYAWAGPNSYTSTVQNPSIANVNLGAQGAYTVTVTNTSTTCKSTAVANVTVNTAPPVNVSDNDPCEGSTLILAASGGVSYSWSGPNAFTSTLQNPNIASVTTAAGGTYSVLVTAANACTAIGTTTVTIKLRPSPITASSNSPLCEGAALNLNASGGTSYLWSGPNAFSASTQNPSVTGATASNAGLYLLTVTGSNGCSASTSTDVVIHANPVANAGTDQTINMNQTATLSGSASGGSGNYNWNWQPAASLVNHLDQNPSTTALLTTTLFTLIATDQATGCVSTSAQVTVNVNTQTLLDVYFMVYPGPSICVGSGISFISSATGGSGVYTYSWTGPNGFTSSEQNPSISDASLAAAGTYNLTINDGTNSADASPVTISMIPNPAAFSITSGGAYCQGTAGIEVGLDGSEEGISYQLLQNGNPIGTPVAGTGAAFTFGTFEAGLYTATATNICTTLAMNGASLITENPVPASFVVSGGGLVCPEASVWINIDGSQTETAYNVYLDNNLTATSLTGTGTAISFEVTAPGFYSVVAVNSCGSTELMGLAFVSAGSLPTVYNVQGGGVLCQGASGTLTLEGSESGSTYQLYNNLTAVGSPVTGTGTMLEFPVLVAGTYTIAATNVCGTTNMTGSAVFTALASATIFNVTGGGTMCTGGTGFVVGLDGSETETTYTLYRDGAAIAGAINGDGNAISFGIQTIAGNYTIEASSECGNVMMNGSANIIVNTYPSSFTVSGGGDLCASSVSGGQSANVAFSPTVNLSGSEIGVIYSLLIDGAASGQADISGTGAAISFGEQTAAGVYSIVGTNGCGAITMSGTATVNVNPAPAVFNMNGGTEGASCIVVETPVGLDGSEADVTYTLFLDEVNTGNDAIGTGSALTFGNFTDAGTYTALATNSFGCTSAMLGSVAITLLPSPVILLNPSNASAVEGGNASFTVSAINTTTYSWAESTDGGASWLPITDGGIYSGTSSATLHLTGVLLSMNTNQYRCTLAEGPCEVNTTAASLSVTALGANITCTVENFTTCQGQVIIPVIVGNFLDVAATSLVLNFNPSVLTYTGFQNVNPLLNDAATMLVNASSGSLLISHYTLTPSNIGAGTLVELIFQYTGGTTNLNWDVVTPGNCMFSDFNDNTLPSLFFNGSVNQLGSAAVITSQPAGVTVNAGDNATFHASASGAATYQWQTYTTTWVDLAEVAPFSGTQTTDLLITAATGSLNGNQFRLVAKDADCQVAVNSDGATLNVITPTLDLTTTAAAVTACGNNQVIVPIGLANLSNVAAISLRLTYDAAVASYVSIQNINPAFNPAEINIYNLPGDWRLSWYSLVPISITTGNLADLVFDYYGGSTDLVWDITTGGYCEYNDIDNNIIPSVFVNGSITPSASQPLVTAQPADVTINDGDNAGFSVVATNATSYQWQIGVGSSSWTDLVDGGIYAGVNTASLSITPATITMNHNNYRVVVSNGECSLNSDVAVLHVSPIGGTVITTAGSVTACTGQEITIPVSAQYVYNVGAISLTLNYNPSAISYITYSNLNPQLAGGSVNIFDLPGEWKFSWYSLTPVNIGSGNLFDLVFNYNGGSTDLTWDVTNPGNCEYDDFDGNIIPATYVNGHVGPSASQPQISSGPASISVIDGANAIFSVVASNAAAYQWEISTDGGVSWTNVTDGGAFSGATTSDLMISPATILMNGNLFKVWVDGGNCAVYSSSATLGVSPYIASVHTIAPNVQGCPEFSVIVPVEGQYIYDVAAISLTLHYDPSVLTYTGYQNLNAQLALGSVNIFDIPGEWRMSWYSLAPINVGSANLVDLVFDYHGGYTDLTWDLSIPGNCEYDDFGGNILPAIYTNGSVGPNSDVPSITSQPSDLTVTHHDNASFHVVADLGNTYQWQISIDGGSSWANIADGGHYSGATTPDLFITDAIYLFNGYQFHCVVSRDVCYAISNAATLTVLPILPFTVTTIVPAATACPGTDIVIPIDVTDFYSVAANSLTLNYDEAVLTYTGTQNLNPAMSSALVSQTSGEFKLSWYSLTPLSLGDATIVELLFHYNGGSTDLSWDLVNSGNCEYDDFDGNIMPSAFVNGSVSSSALAPVIVTQPASVTSFVGAPAVSFSVDATFATSYQWQVSVDGINWANITDNDLYSGATTATLGIATLIVDLNGHQYQVIVNGTCTLSTTSTPATLTVYSLIIATAGSVNQCASEAITIPLSVEHLYNVGAMSLTVDYNSSEMTFVGYQDLNPAIDPGFLLVNAVNGQVKIGYASITPLNFGDGQLLSLVFSSAGSSSSLSWDNVTPGNCEFLDFTSGTIINSQYVNGSVVINALPVINITPVATLCIDGAAVTLTATPAGGTFSGTGVVDGTFDPAVAGIGTWAVTYNYTDALGCSNSASIDVVVSALPEVTFTAAGPFCIDAAAYTLVGTPAGGTFTGTGVAEGMFNPSVAGAGTWTLTYTYVSEFGCSNFATTDVVVNALPVLTIPVMADVCVNAGATALVAFPEGGTFSGTGVADNMFYPAVAGLGTWTINYSYTDANGCTNSDNFNVTVIPLTEITASPVSVGLDETGNTFFDVTAINATSYQWQVSVDGGTSWTDLSDGGVYTGVTTNHLVLTGITLDMNGNQYQAIASGLCAPAVVSGSATLTVTPIILTIAGDVVQCAGNAILVPVSVEHLYGVGALSLTLNYNATDLTYVGYQDVNPLINSSVIMVNAIGGQVKIGYFNIDPLNIGNGLMLNLIFSSNGGYSDFSWDNVTVGECEYISSEGVTITSQYVDGSLLVHPLPVITFDNIGPFCIDAAAVTLNALPLGGTFSGNGVSAGMFNPADAGVGTSTITYNYTDALGCTNSASIEVIVNPLPVVTIDAAGPFCIDTPATTLVGHPAGGTFSGTGIVGNTFNAAIAGVGTFTITYTYADANGCVNFTTTTVVVNPLPVVSFDAIGPFCSNAASVVLSGSPAGGSFSGVGVTGNEFNPSVAGPGTWVLTYTYTNENGCTNSASISVVVNMIPTAFPVFGGGEYCSGGIGLNVGTGGSEAGFQYFLYLDGVNTGQMRTGTGSILNFGLQLLPGTYTIYAMNPGTGCNNWLSGSVTVVVNPLPNVYGGGYSIICQGSSTTINAVVNGGTAPYLYSWTPAASLSSPNVLNPVASPSVTTFYQVVVTDSKGCSSSDNALVVVNAAPIVSAGPDKVINVGMITPLNASVSGGHAPYTYLWTPATGLNNANVLVPLASPVVTTTYTLLVTDNVGCTSSDQVTVTVTGTPLGYNINGFVTYDNLLSSPMTNTNVNLSQNSALVNTTVTNIAGSYGFSLIPNGLYSITGSTTKVWGGGNSVDALIMARHFVGLQTLAGLKLLAGDLDGNGVVNAADALLVMRRSVLLINTFSVGDWIFETKSANVNNGNLAIDFKALCFGDVNGSNTPALKLSPSVNINTDGIMAIENNKVFELPIRAGENLSLGAASLVINYPANAIDILNVMVAGNSQTSNLIYLVQDEKLFVEWYNLNPLSLAVNDVLFTLQVRIKDVTAIENMTFSIEGESQLADASANVLANAQLSIPKLQLINVAFSLGDNYPNPFNQFTTINYTTPDNGNVNLSVYNMIGEKVADLVQANQDAGSYSVTLDGTSLPAGVYTYRLRVQGTTQSFDQSKRMIISR